MAQEYNQVIENIKCSFAIEGINLSNQSLRNLERLSNGKVSISELIQEISERYRVE